jgi:hypothetical protein
VKGWRLPVASPAHGFGLAPAFRYRDSFDGQVLVEALAASAPGPVEKGHRRPSRGPLRVRQRALPSFARAAIAVHDDPKPGNGAGRGCGGRPGDRACAPSSCWLAAARRQRNRPISEADGHPYLPPQAQQACSWSSRKSLAGGIGLTKGRKVVRGQPDDPLRPPRSGSQLPRSARAALQLLLRPGMNEDPRLHFHRVRTLLPPSLGRSALSPRHSCPRTTQTQVV